MVRLAHAGEQYRRDEFLDSSANQRPQPFAAQRRSLDRPWQHTHRTSPATAIAAIQVAAGAPSLGAHPIVVDVAMVFREQHRNHIDGARVQIAHSPAGAHRAAAPANIWRAGQPFPPKHAGPLTAHAPAAKAPGVHVLAILPPPGRVRPAAPGQGGTERSAPKLQAAPAPPSGPPDSRRRGRSVSPCVL